MHKKEMSDQDVTFVYVCMQACTVRVRVNPLSTVSKCSVCRVCVCVCMQDLWTDREWGVVGGRKRVLGLAPVNVAICA